LYQLLKQIGIKTETEEETVCTKVDEIVEWASKKGLKDARLDGIFAFEIMCLNEKIDPKNAHGKQVSIPIKYLKEDVMITDVVALIYYPLFTNFVTDSNKQQSLLAEYIKDKYGLRLITDIHESYQARPVGEVVDVIQIPAFLCRQTDLLVAAAKTGKTVNIKKAQFLSGLDMAYPVQKVRESGNENVWLTERGNMYGYNNLVVDFRNIPDMKQITDTVVMDCTHCVQRPGSAGGATGGNREFIPAMALAAKAFGANGYFFEIHPDPDNALSDGPNMLKLNEFESVIESLL
jgi:2-dehydro-3-deoxyphosphooctonate aldolase (KDO 8-P synthase)